MKEILLFGKNSTIKNIWGIRGLKFNTRKVKI